MKKFVFLASHLHSGVKELAKSLNSHPRVQIYSTNSAYQHPDDLDPILTSKHKLNNAAAIYGDQLLFNQSLSSDSLYSACHFVYLIREAGPVLDELVRDGYPVEQAMRHYAFRLRRLCEMAKKTPGAVLLTWQDLKDNRLDCLVKYLELKTAIPEIILEPNAPEVVDNSFKFKSQDCYERHLYFLRSLSLLRP